MRRGEPMPTLVELEIKPLRANASEANVAEHERTCKTIAAYEQARLDALESSHRFGAALWDARIATLEVILATERAALKGKHEQQYSRFSSFHTRTRSETQRSIDELNAERKSLQLRTGERLFASEREFVALCNKNVELSRVIQQLQSEIDELQRRARE
jgi:hypothetical protein